MAVMTPIALAGASSPDFSADSIGLPSSSPGRMEGISATRRGAVAALFGAGAVASLVMTQPAIASALPTQSAPAPDARRAAWDRALREYLAAREAQAAFWRDVCGPAYAEHDRHVEPVELEFSVTARSGQVATYRMLPGQLDDYCASPIRPIAEGAAALRERREKFMADSKEWRARLDLDRLDERNDELIDAEYAAEQTLLDTPAPDGNAYAHKVAVMLEFDLAPENYLKLRNEAAALAGISTRRE